MIYKNTICYNCIIISNAILGKKFMTETVIWFRIENPLIISEFIEPKYILVDTKIKCVALNTVRKKFIKFYCKIDEGLKINTGI